MRPSNKQEIECATAIEMVGELICSGSHLRGSPAGRLLRDAWRGVDFAASKLQRQLHPS